MSKKGGIAAISQGRSDVFKVSPDDLHVKAGWNSRNFNDQSNIDYVDELARSIAAKGVLEPLTVIFEDNKAYVRNGECRLRATKRAIEIYKADIKNIPVRIEERYANEAEQLVNQYIRNSGKPFTALELSAHFKRLLGAGYEVKDIVAKTGLTAGRVSQILGLNMLPEGVKKEIQAGHVSPTLAQQTVAQLGPTEAEKQLKAGWATAVEEGKTKVSPQHIEGVKPTLNKAVKDAFDCSDVDTDQEGDYVVITMPRREFAVLREMLNL